MGNSAKKNRVSFKIFNQNYNILTSHSQQYIDELIEILNSHIELIENSSLKDVSVLLKMIFASMNLAEDYMELSIENERIRAQLEEPSFEVTRTKEKIEDINSLLDKKNKEYVNIKKDFDELIRLSNTYENDLKALRGKMNLLSFELENKDLELTQSNERIKYLEDLIK